MIENQNMKIRFINRRPKSRKLFLNETQSKIGKQDNLKRLNERGKN